jgi:hypothetical protein
MSALDVTTRVIGHGSPPSRRSPQLDAILDVRVAAVV